MNIFKTTALGLIISLSSGLRATETPAELFPISLFPVNLSELEFSHSIAGGSGGIAVLKDKNGNKFTLKAAKHADQIKEEILTDALYRALGVAVPAFIVVDTLPKSLLAKLPLSNQNGPFRLALFIHKGEQVGYDAKDFNRSFMVDAFLSNHDRKGAHDDNLIIDSDGVLWRIDNGGGLRHKAKGDKKEVTEHFNPHRVTELKTMGKDGLTDEEIGDQAADLTSAFPGALVHLRQIGAMLGVGDLEELENSLVSRYRNLVTQFGTNLDPIAYAYERAVPLTTSASVFIYKHIDDEPYVLLGKRSGTGLWGNLGGASDAADKLLADSASREVFEESMSLLKIPALALLQQPSHDLLTPNAEYGFTRHRMYFYEATTDFNIESLKQALSRPATESGEVEYTDFAWIKVTQLVHTLQNAQRVQRVPSRSSNASEDTVTLTISGDSVDIHPPFYRSLTQPEAFTQVLNIAMRRPLFRQHTQGWYRPSAAGQLWPIDPKGHMVTWMDNNTHKVMDNNYTRVESINDLSLALARTVIDRATMLAQIKTLDASKVSENFSSVLDISDNRMKGIRKNYFTNEYMFDDLYASNQGFVSANTNKVDTQDLKSQRSDTVHPLLKDLKVSQTEAYLRNQFKEYDVNSSLFENAKRFLQANVINPRARDAHFLSTIEEMLRAEQAHNKQFFAFYSAADSEIGFLAEVMTEARAHLQALSSDDFKLLRGNDSVFEAPNVLEFLRRQGDIRDALAGKNIIKALDYTPGFQDQAISASLSPFSAHKLELESALHYFIRRQSIAPPPLPLMLTKFFKNCGLRIDSKKYEDLYEAYFEAQSGGDKSKRANTTMFQLFMNPDLVEQLTYNSGTGGGLSTFLISEDYNPKNSLLQLLSDPSRADTSQVYSHQVKIWLTPAVMFNPELLQVKQYWQQPMSSERAREFKAKLSQLIHDDLVLALHNKVAKREHTYRTAGALGNGTLSPVEKVFQLAYEEILDAPVPYKLFEATQKDLEEALQNRDYNEFYALFSRWEERSAESLDSLYNLVIRNLKSDADHAKEATDALAFVIKEGKRIDVQHVKAFVTSITKDNFKSLSPALALLLDQVQALPLEVVADAALRAKSPQLLAQLFNRGFNIFGMQDKIDNLLNSVLLIGTYDRSNLEILKALVRKFSPVSDAFLHSLLRTQDWTLIETVADIDLNSVFRVAAQRVVEPSSEWMRQYFDLAQSDESDHGVNEASYERVKKLLARRPAPEAIDNAISDALFHLKSKLLLVLLPFKPSPSPLTDARVDSLISKEGTESYAGDIILRDAILWRSHSISDLFLERMGEIDMAYYSLALQAGNDQVIEKMVKKKMNLPSALHIAIHLQNTNAVRILIDAMQHVPSYLLGSGVSTFNPEIIALLERRSGPEAIGFALMEAVRSGNTEVFEQLIDDERLDPSYVSASLRSAIWWRSNSVRTIERLYERLLKLRAKGVSVSLEEPILACIDEGNLTLLQRIVNDFNPSFDFSELNITPLGKAVLIGDLEMVDFLLQNGADPSYHKPWENSPLLLAVNRHFKHLPNGRAITLFLKTLKAEFGEDYELDRWDESRFYSYKDHPEASNEVGKRIFELVLKLNLSLVKRLLEAGADPNPELKFPSPVVDEEEEDSDDPVVQYFREHRRNRKVERTDWLQREHSPLRAALNNRLMPVADVLAIRVE